MRSRRERGVDRGNLFSVRAGDRAGDHGIDRIPYLQLVELHRAAKSAFFRTLMRLELRYTIYDSDVVVIERPQGPAIVVDLSTGRIENV